MALGELTNNIVNVRSAARSLFQACGIERRKKLRLSIPFPAVVRGVDVTGDRFQMYSVIDDLSSCSMYLRLARPVEPGTRLFLVVRLSTRSELDVFAPHVAAQGIVLRMEPQHDTRYGIAVIFTRHRFIYTNPNRYVKP